MEFDAAVKGPGADVWEAGFQPPETADAALDWARRIPTASNGTVEVRPIVEFEG